MALIMCACSQIYMQGMPKNTSENAKKKNREKNTMKINQRLMHKTQPGFYFLIKSDPLHIITGGYFIANKFLRGANFALEKFGCFSENSTEKIGGNPK